ncbi:MAG: hypothetical protein CFE46_14705 [Burkholderiales bacterium PBB6]|nr:MAG: hypothetical protein CFE46_14705 [Burkholderiales bacterium PBB6]
MAEVDLPVLNRSEPLPAPVPSAPRVQRLLGVALLLLLAVAEAVECGDALALWAQLTPREREVARHVAVGATNKAIARTLVPECSPRSVKTHRANLFAKLGVANDNALGRWMARFESMLA